MIASVMPGGSRPSATDGEIAVRNLESARRAAWTRFARDARGDGVAEAVVDLECQAAHFLGNLEALDRMGALATGFESAEESARASFILAKVASIAHRFEEAQRHLQRAAHLGGCLEALELQRMTIDQARGVNLDCVLAARRRIAAKSGRLEDQVPLGALLGDLERFFEADAVYQEAFCSYDGVSPFPLAWVCFQLGILWGESMPVADPAVAALWYRRAIDYLPAYVRARVHLAEILMSQGEPETAEALLRPALPSGDPEVNWRLADLLRAQGRSEEAETQLEAARVGFENLIGRHPLAFADHAAEFYGGSGGDRQRAGELARLNVENRPTRLALRQALTLGAERQG